MDRKTGTPKGKALEDVFYDKYADLRRVYEANVRRLDERKDELNAMIRGVEKNGIHLLDHVDVMSIYSYLDVDAYKVIAHKCELWHRPYVKCVRTSHARIVVVVTGTGAVRDLVSTLLIGAKKMDVNENKEPDFLKNKNIGYYQDKLTSWVTSRTITLLFQDREGARLFEDWAEFCKESYVHRMVLGIKR